MRMLMMFMLTLSMMSSAFAGILSERDRSHGSPWFQDCEQEVARPFCGTLKIDPAVEAMVRQLDKHASLDPKGDESSPKESSATPYGDGQDTPKAALHNQKGGNAAE